MVAASKLDDSAPPRVAPRQAQSRHGGFGAGGGETHFLDRGQSFDDQLRQLNFFGRWRTETCSLLERLFYRSHHLRMRMPGNERAP